VKKEKITEEEKPAVQARQNRALPLAQGLDPPLKKAAIVHDY